MTIEKIIKETRKLYGLQDTLRDIEKSGLFNHVPFEEYAQTLERLFDLVEVPKIEVVVFSDEEED